MSDESVRAHIREEQRWEDLSPEIRKQVEQSLADGISFGLKRDGRGRGHLTSIHWNPGMPNALAEALKNNVEEDEMPLWLDGQKFMIRQVPNDETETR